MGKRRGLKTIEGRGGSWGGLGLRSHRRRGFGGIRVQFAHLALLAQFRVVPRLGVLPTGERL